MTTKNIDNEKLAEVVNALDHMNDDHWTKAGLIDLNHVKEAMGTNVSREEITEAGFDIVTRESTKAGAETPADGLVKDPTAPADEPTIEDKDAIIYPDDPDSLEKGEAPEFMDTSVFGDFITIYSAQDPDNDDHWNDDGYPSLKYLSGQIGFTITTGHLARIAGNIHREQFRADKIHHEELVKKHAVTVEVLPDNAIIFPDKSTPIEAGAFMILMLDRLTLMLTPEVRTRQGELAEVFQLFMAERPTILAKQERLVKRVEMDKRTQEMVKEG